MKGSGGQNKIYLLLQFIQNNLLKIYCYPRVMLIAGNVV